MNIDHDLVILLTQITGALHILGILSAIKAIDEARSPQGAIAWAIALCVFPYVTLPIFWILGRDRFNGYTVDRRVEDSKLAHVRRSLVASTKSEHCKLLGIDPSTERVLVSLAAMPFTYGNQARLLINGTATFDSIFSDIDAAKKYLLIQFFIIHDDDIGRRFKQHLIAAAQRGVRVYLLYDEIGSHALSRKYIADLRQANVHVRAFKTTKGTKNRFQINFRNHRKIVVADGIVTSIGGHNVGDEYLGKNPKFGFWRDTHVRVEGSAALQAQASFVEDWHWSSGEVLSLDWQLPEARQGIPALILPSGPADTLDTCCLFFLQAINSAQQRLWITSPYFVPDPQILSALQLAAMRGVDVRIVLPCMADHLFVYLASFALLKDALPFGIKLYRFQNGFIHQKVVLVDNHFASVGTANFDNRSFRLNFEITGIFVDQEFAHQVENMLSQDFAQSKPVTMAEIDDRSMIFRVAVKFARLLSPIL